MLRVIKFAVGYDKPRDCIPVVRLSVVNLALQLLNRLRQKLDRKDWTKLDQTTNNVTGIKQLHSQSSNKYVYLSWFFFLVGQSIDKDGCPGLWLAETFSATTERDGTKLDWEAITQRTLISLCFSSQFIYKDGHPDLWLAETFPASLQPLITFDETSLNVLYQVCVFRIDPITEMAALVSI